MVHKITVKDLITRKRKTTPINSFHYMRNLFVRLRASKTSGLNGWMVNWLVEFMAC